MTTNDDPIPVSSDATGSLSAIPSGIAGAPMSTTTMSSFSAADVVESAMRRLVPDLQVRAEVEESLREMVLDVEMAHHLQDQASKHLVIQRLRNEIEQHKHMLDERTMLDVERRETEAKLADQLVRELWVLSEEMGQLKMVEAQHKELLMQHDEVVAQLLQAQEELADAQERGRSSSTNAADPPTAVGASSLTPAPAQEGRGDAGTGAGAGGVPAADNRASSATSTPPASAEPVSAPSIKPETPPESPPAPEEAPPTESKTTTPPTSDVVPAPEPAASEGDVSNPTISSVEQEKEAVPTAPVVALEEEQEQDAPKLEEFEESILMLIFSFLDALDILNTAQVNISMYSRVDTLFFGNGNDPNSDDNSTIGTNENTASSNTDRSVPTTAASSTTTSNPPSTPKASSSSASTAVAKSPPPPTATSSSTSTAAAHSPTVVRLPPPATPAKPASAAATTTGATTTGAAATAGQSTLSPPAPTSSASTPASTTTAAVSPSRAAASGLSLFSSILQPRLPGAASAASAVASTKAAVPTGTIVGTATAAAVGTTTSGLLVPHRRSASVDAGHQSQQQQQQPMNAAMANSMASKLSDAELNAIIVMTERLKSREQLAEKLRRENDELRAKLDGADALKEYLINKVRDMEKSLSSTEEQDAKTALQIASDQEVIAFLDARVQELEAEGRVRSKELEESVRQRQQIKSDADQKVKVLSDMLQFERERVKENEVEWKATRKVLVKEVKNLRAQMAALVAERDGYREQNEQLRRAVVSTGPSFSNISASSPSRLRQGSFS